MKNLFYLLTLTIFFACSNTKSQGLQPVPLTEEEIVEASALLKTHCYACHGPEGDMDTRIAPPMIAVKRHYLDKGLSQEEFVRDVMKYVPSPDKSLSKMPGAIKRFGLMAPLPIPEADLRKIAIYIYQQEIEEPAWFKEHYEKMHGDKMKKSK